MSLFGFLFGENDHPEYHAAWERMYARREKYLRDAARIARLREWAQRLDDSPARSAYLDWADHMDREVRREAREAEVRVAIAKVSMTIPHPPFDL